MTGAGVEFLRRMTRGDYGNECEVGPWVETQDGYHETHIFGKKWKVHRWVYSEVMGPIPDGMVVAHRCKKRSCVNPNHLELMTLKESSRRGQERRVKPKSCRHGHVYDEDNTHVSPTGHRVCRKCRNSARRRWASRHSSVDTIEARGTE